MTFAAHSSAEFFAGLRFSDSELADLVSALSARAAGHPDNPGLIACLPAVPAHRMDAACRELRLRGHSVRSVPVAGWQSAKTRSGWAIDA